MQLIHVLFHFVGAAFGNGPQCQNGRFLDPRIGTGQSSLQFGQECGENVISSVKVGQGIQTRGGTFPQSPFIAIVVVIKTIFVVLLVSVAVVIIIIVIISVDIAICSIGSTTTIIGWLLLRLLRRTAPMKDGLHGVITIVVVVLILLSIHFIPRQNLLSLVILIHHVAQQVRYQLRQQCSNRIHHWRRHDRFVQTGTKREPKFRPFQCQLDRLRLSRTIQQKTSNGFQMILQIFRTVVQQRHETLGHPRSYRHARGRGQGAQR
mmetsp:Transcript_21517/g.46658  ORF Transcript_21517/g.46658 Transcript_21517/m.46658 type:complete len:263 (-) Transcript_21517:863-1651(-)